MICEISPKIQGIFHLSAEIQLKTQEADKVAQWRKEPNLVTLFHRHLC